MQMKDGFTFDRTAAEGYGGSFSRRGATVQHGGQRWPLGLLRERRLFRRRRLARLLELGRAAVLRVGELARERGRLDVSAAFAESELRGNGTAPAELLDDRPRPGLHPSRHHGKRAQPADRGGLVRRVRGISRGRERVLSAPSTRIPSMATAPSSRSASSASDEFLVEEDFVDLNGDGECSADVDDDIALVLDPEGEPIDSRARWHGARRHQQPRAPRAAELWCIPAAGLRFGSRCRPPQ